MEATALSVPAGTNRNSVFRPYREGAARFLPTFIRMASLRRSPRLSVDRPLPTKENPP